MENKGAIQEKPCQKRSMNLEFTVETRLVPWAEGNPTMGCSVALHRGKELLLGAD